MKRVCILLLSILLGACASAPPPPPAAHLFHDHLFAPSGADMRADAIFALTPDMQAYAAGVLRNDRKKEPQLALFEALYRKDKLQLEYDSATTRNAAGTFAARRGNCLSLVVMTAALAREMGLQVQFQQVRVEDTWSRSGALYFASGHVNLVLGKRNLDNLRDFDHNKHMVVDFQPPEEVEHLVTTPVEQHTVVAMFMNNRAAEAMAAKQLDDAYWWARQAIGHDRAFVNAYNTLGIIYQHHGNLTEAEAALRHAHALEPASTIIMHNLAQVLDLRGQGEAAAALRATLARLEPHPPFHYFNLGQQAMREGDYQRARALFAREVRRAPHYHEFHFWLAQAAFRLGDVAAANQHLRQALANSTTGSDTALYAGKLDRLKALERRREPVAN